MADLSQIGRDEPSGTGCERHGRIDKIPEHRGEARLSAIYPLARLNKARALKDKTEYERFFELGKKPMSICRHY